MDASGGCVSLWHYDALLGRMPRAHALRAPGLSAAARWKRRQSEAPVRSCIFKPRGEIKHPFGPAERRNRPPRGHFWPANRTAEGSVVCLEDGGKAAESHLRASLTCLLFGRGGRVASRAASLNVHAAFSPGSLSLLAFSLCRIKLQSVPILDACVVELCCCISGCCCSCYRRGPAGQHSMRLQDTAVIFFVLLSLRLLPPCAINGGTRSRYAHISGPIIYFFFSHPASPTK